MTAQKKHPGNAVNCNKAVELWPRIKAAGVGDHGICAHGLFGAPETGSGRPPRLRETKNPSGDAPLSEQQISCRLRCHSQGCAQRFCFFMITDCQSKIDSRSSSLLSFFILISCVWS